MTVSGMRVTSTVARVAPLLRDWPRTRPSFRNQEGVWATPVQNPSLGSGCCTTLAIGHGIARTASHTTAAGSQRPKFSWKFERSGMRKPRGSKERSQMSASRHVRWTPSSVAPMMGLFLVACGGAASTGAKGATGTVRDLEIHHENCDLHASGTRSTDVNGDGRPDLFSVMKDGHELCRAADLDFDGKIDIWTYFDDQGRVRRRELDYNRDGQIDEIQRYSRGQLVAKERSSTLSHHLDTWETYVGGKLRQVERDSNGDGKVDQWWDFKTPDCPIIASDVDGNGQPDPNAVVNYCSESDYRPPEQAQAEPASPLREETQPLPTETSDSESSGTEAQPSNQQGGQDSKPISNDGSPSGDKP